ncbi:hypothetical protein RB195_022873 [Necator americanus]|uniref:Secreted protein n=1 Tax=Necator americanus TaxID=51031 RepID=A0ABR1EGX5_NECAM
MGQILRGNVEALVTTLFVTLNCWTLSSWKYSRHSVSIGSSREAESLRKWNRYDWMDSTRAVAVDRECSAELCSRTRHPRRRRIGEGDRSWMKYMGNVF